MKKIFLLLIATLLILPLTINAQNDTVYVMKSGAVIFRYKISEIDSMIFYNPKIGSVADLDGNTYKTITIGSQVWMSENLRTTKYNDGTPITLVTDNTTWKDLTTPGYCWYNNDYDNYGSIYGALYNWYAVNTGKICPTGWHVATDDEWKQLEMYLGMSQSDADLAGWRGTAEGAALADSANLWFNSNLVNHILFGSSGFTALPAGHRVENGEFQSLTYNISWWTSTNASTEFAFSRGVSSSITSVLRLSKYKYYGLSVRCLKD